MISKCLSTSRKFTELHSDSARMLFPLLVVHSDDFGRLDGSAFYVKHNCIPTLQISEAKVEDILNDLAQVGLIKRASIQGVLIIQICQFDEHQVGLSRRTKSKFSEIHGTSQNFKEIHSELNRTELNGTELNTLPPVIPENTGTPPGMDDKKPIPAYKRIKLSEKTGEFEGIQEIDIEKWRQTFPFDIQAALKETALYWFGQPRNKWKKNWYATIGKRFQWMKEHNCRVDAPRSEWHDPEEYAN